MTLRYLRFQVLVKFPPFPLVKGEAEALGDLSQPIMDTTPTGVISPSWRSLQVALESI
jgi:hypothetical protein